MLRTAASCNNASASQCTSDHGCQNVLKSANLATSTVEGQQWDLAAEVLLYNLDFILFLYLYTLYEVHNK